MGRRKAELTEQARLCDISYGFEVLQLLNHLFDSLMQLNCFNREGQRQELQDLVTQALQNHKDKILAIDRMLQEPSGFTGRYYRDEIEGFTLGKLLSKKFYERLLDDVELSVRNCSQMEDFALAEMNLGKLCQLENIEEPETLFANRKDSDVADSEKVYFAATIFGVDAEKRHNEIRQRIQNKNRMLEIFKDAIDQNALSCGKNIEFYTADDQRIERYFFQRSLQNQYGDDLVKIQKRTLAVLDDQSFLDHDLLFTTEGVIPIILGRAKKTAPYSGIHWKDGANSRRKILDFDGEDYTNKHIDMDQLYALVKELATLEEKGRSSDF